MRTGARIVRSGANDRRQADTPRLSRSQAPASSRSQAPAWERAGGKLPLPSAQRNWRSRVAKQELRNEKNRPEPLALEPLEPRVLLSGTDSALQLFSVSPALFAPNLGQWADEAVRFVHNGSGANVAMTDSGPVFQLFATEPVGGASAPRDSVGGASLPRETDDVRAIQFSASFVGANAVTPVGLEQAETVFNYHVGSDPSRWLDGVPTYEVVAYEGLYDGIDLRTWGRRDALKYEFHVAPGADPGQIRLRYDGIEGLWLDDGGALHIATELGEIVDDAPFIYQDIQGQRTQVEGAFLLLGTNTYSFAITGGFDPDAELVIDPYVAWGSFLAGSSSEDGLGIAVDPWGDAFITGWTRSPDFPTTPGAHDRELGGIHDVFVTRVSGTGALLWSTFVGGSGVDTGRGIAVDRWGNAFITGTTTSSDFPTPGGFDATMGGGDDGFVMKLSAGGALLWSSYLGGSIENDVPTAVAVDDSGDAFVVGYTLSPDFPVPGGFDTFLDGAGDAFVTKVSGAGGPGALQWSTFLGGGGADYGWGIVVNGAGDAFITGTTTEIAGSVNFPTTPGAFDTTLGGTADAFVTKVSGTGSLVWSTYLGGSDSEWGFGIALDVSGNPLVTGRTASADFPTSPGVDRTFNGTTDAFVTKFSGSGAFEWSTYLGGAQEDWAEGIAVDGQGNSYLTGYTESPDFPTPNGFDATYGGAIDAFVTKMSGSGVVLWSSYLGGAAVDWGRSVALDRSGRVFLTGMTKSSDFPTPGGFDQTLDAHDAFVAIVQENQPPVNTVPGAQTVLEDNNLLFSAGNGNAISVSDADASTLLVTLAGTNGVLSLSGTNGLTFSIGDGTADPLMEFTGTIVDINAALNGLVFSSPQDYNGPASVQIVADDQGNTGSGGPLTDTDTVNVTVNAVNDPPTANSQSATTPEDTALGIILTGTDGDPDVVQVLTFAIATGPSHGSLSGFNPATGAVTYTPVGDYNGPDSFTFTVTDDVSAGSPVNLTSAPATVSITVTAVNDAPVAQAGAFGVTEDGSHSGSVAATDVDGDPLTYAIVTGPAHGALTAFNTSTGAFTYEPADDYNGPDGFTFKANDGTVDSNTATVTITVTPVNDAPAVNDQTLGPIAENSPNGAVVGSVPASDVDTGQTLTYAIVGGNTGGAFAISSSTGQITVASVAAVDFETTPSFGLTVQVTDNGSPTLSDTATVTINLTDVNETPVVNNQALGPLAENSADGTVVGTVTASDPDAGQTLTYAITGGNTGGAFTINSSTGQITVASVAAVDFETTPSFGLTVQVTDNGSPTLSDTGTVTINLLDDDEVPEFVAPFPGDPSIVIIGQPFEFDFSASDEEAGPLAYSLIAGPTWLSMDAATGVLSGTPGRRAHLGDSDVTVRVSDAGRSDDFTFRLTVQGQVITLSAALPIPLTKTTYIDAGGDLVSVSAKGLGTFYLVRGVAPDGTGNYSNNTPGDLVSIEGEGTDAKSALSLKVSSPTKAPSPNTSVRDMVVNGSFNLAAPALNLLGDMRVTGGVGKLTLGDVADQHTLSIGAGPLIASASIVLGRVQDASLTSATPLKSLSVVEWLDSYHPIQRPEDPPDVITAPWISSLATRRSKVVGGPAGNFQASVNLSGAGATKGTLGKVSIAGSVLGGTWSITGAAGSVAVRGNWSNCSFQADWLKSLSVVGRITEDNTDGDWDVIRVLNGVFSVRDVTWSGSVPPEHWFDEGPNAGVRAYVG